jgi:long-chain fatty acid transport protein
VSHADNLGLINDNPAGLAWLEEGLWVEFGGDVVFPSVKYDDPDDSDESRGVFPLPYFSIAGRKSGIPLTFGLSAFLPGGFGGRYKLEHPVYGRQTYLSDGLLFKLLPCVAWRVGDRVSLGGGLGLGYSQARFKFPYTFQSGPFAGQAGLADSDTDGFGWAWNIGLQFRPTKKLALGVTFTSETFTRQEGSFDLDVTGSPLAGLFSDPTASYDVEYHLRWPRSAGVGVSYELGFGRVSFDTVWYDWSKALQEINLRLSDSDNAEFDTLVGCCPTDTFPLDWDDSISIRVGYEHFLGTRTTLRTGYTYNLNPVPRSTLTPLLPGVVEHIAGVGMRHEFDCLQLDVAYQYGFGSEDKVGKSDIEGGDFDSSRIRGKGHWLSVTMTWKP